MDPLDIAMRALTNKLGADQAQFILEQSKNDSNLPDFPVHPVNKNPNAIKKPTGKSSKREPGTLPVWSDDKRGVPHALVRTAIFAPVKKGEKQRLKNTIIASIDGMTVKQTGSELDQNDFLVWMQLVHLARIQGTNTNITFTAAEFLKSIGKGTSKHQYEWLKETAAELIAQSIEVRTERYSYVGPLVRQFVYDNEEGHYVLEINSDMAKLFDAGNWCTIEADHHLNISTELGKWLYSFFSSHKSGPAGIAYSVEKLHALCRSDQKVMRAFKQKLKTSMNAVVEQTGWKYEFEGNILRVFK